VSENRTRFSGALVIGSEKAGVGSASAMGCCVRWRRSWAPYVDVLLCAHSAVPLRRLVVLWTELLLLSGSGRWIMPGPGMSERNREAAASCPGLRRCHLSMRLCRHVPVIQHGTIAPEGRTIFPSALRLHLPTLAYAVTASHSRAKCLDALQKEQTPFEGALRAGEVAAC
jgi:hypothetical protein